jgi:hypothetical protein
MVLVGAVTFSVTNSLLADDTINRKDQANESTIANKLNTNNSINHTEKKLNNQSTKAVEDNNKNVIKEPLPIRSINKSEPTSSSKISLHTQTSSNKTNTQTQIRKTSTTTAAANTTTTSSKPITNQKTITNTNKTTTASQSTSKTTATATATPTPSAAPTTATTNHGKQVSQDAREKAVNRKVQQVNNGKKK